MRDTLAVDTSQCFFHYTTRDAAFGRILPSGQLRFSSYDRMRDPLENKEWWFEGEWPEVEPEVEDPLEDAYEAFQQLAAGIRHQAHLLAFTVDVEGYGPRNARLAKGWARARMWEAYAENHAGVCLLFDRERLTDALNADLRTQLGFGSYHRSVRYTEAGNVQNNARFLRPADWPEEIDGGFVADYVEEHHRELFFLKTLDWQSEQEYRFVTTAAPEQPLYASYGDALVGVLVGERIPDWQRPAVLESSRAAGIDPAVMNWHVTWPYPYPVPLVVRSPGERSRIEAEQRARFPA